MFITEFTRGKVLQVTTTDQYNSTRQSNHGNIKGTKIFPLTMKSGFFFGIFSVIRNTSSQSTFGVIENSDVVIIINSHHLKKPNSLKLLRFHFWKT
jgi:hypothetical protein